MRRVIVVVAALAAACSSSNGKDGQNGQNGQNGKNTLVTVDPVAPGTACPAGGFAISSGLDANGNGVLDASEIATTSTVCNGQDGLSTLFTSTTEPAGAHCTSGGVKLESGLDSNRDGTLQPAEVTSTSYVCNGANGGLDGHDFLVSITPELPGTNCSTGGLRIQGGLDVSRDGTLQPAEVTSTSYVCNGATGQDGLSTLFASAPEPAGANCPAGGTVITSGLDANRNGVLEPGEVTSTSFVCDGLAGLDALVSTAAEPAGANCANGGIVVRTGADLNGDGVLQPGEVSGTRYVCNGAPGAQGNPGAVSLVRQVDEPAGANCTFGGKAIMSGVDTNGNGALDASEVTATSYVCNGAPGAPGTNGLNSAFLVTAEPAGANCPTGGEKVQTGLDSNRNGALDPAEVTATSYVCDGAAGTPGAVSLVRQAVEPAGPNCTFGGTAITSGVDTNGNGALDPSEVTATSYVCNGAPGPAGLNSVFLVTAESAGANCPTGGEKIQTGLDSNRNGVLDPTEVTATSYVCNGAMGASGLTSVFLVTAEPAGANCSTGGEKIQAGLDANRNGVLDPPEVTATSYVCNGTPGAPGTNGLNSAFLVTAEPAGANCPVGGEKIQTGLDSNRNGVLDPAEVTATSYVCNGSSRLYAFSSALLGGVCPRGGVRIDTGIDANGNGALDPSEIQPSLTQYVCNVYLVDVSEGFQSACALVSDGTVSCWGDNSLGQLGDATLPTALTPVSVPGVAGASAISVGAFHACALLTDGTARCWGDNEFGQLGNGTATPQAAPVAVSGLTGATTIAAAGFHSCAVISGGTAQCWGSNDIGQLGDGTTTERHGPVAVTGLTGAVQLTGGLAHTCARRSGGDVKCWGDNEAGQLGDATSVNSSTPVTVFGLAGAVDLSAGSYHNCAALTDGTAWCWGYNSNGQLGDGSVVADSLQPTMVALGTSVSRVAGGFAHSCAQGTDGTVWCWGYNSNGQLGDGTLVDENTPVQVTGLARAARITAGGTSSCAVLTDGSARCWGANDSGQLGDGTTSDSGSPVPVAFP